MVPALGLALLLAQPPVAQPYKDDAVVSAALGRTMKYRVLLPVDYASSAGQYKTLYLLHGLTETMRLEGLGLLALLVSIRPSLRAARTDLSIVLKEI